MKRGAPAHYLIPDPQLRDPWKMSLYANIRNDYYEIV